MVIGEVLNLFIAPVNTSGIREQRDFLELSLNGIKDDKFANKKLEQSVMIVGLKPYNMAKESLDINLPTAALGENILLDFDPHTLPIGTWLEIGSAIIEITQNCTLCKHLTKYHKKLPKLILKHRGVYCKIVKEGVVTKNSSVKVLDRLSA